MFQSNLFRKKSITTILEDHEKGYSDAENIVTGLKRTLTARDLTAFGIAAIVGAGVFATIGKAASDGGPAVALLFIFTAIACSFSALCYAEFASMIPVSGSAYTYAYISFGELIAWIIGWDLILEYGVGNVTVAISWSDYFTSLLNGVLDYYHWQHIPEYLTLDYFSAHSSYDAILNGKATLLNASQSVREGYLAWIHAPSIGDFKIILDLPAFVIVILITYLVFIGMRESRNASNIMVGIKIIILIMLIVVGCFYIKPENWVPFMPNGIGGVLKGVSAVFFAYIGFDAISTAAEETKNPQKNLPRGIIYSLLICTVLYVVISFVLTGMVSYKELNVGDPLAYVFQRVGINAFAGIISLAAVIAMTSVLLVFQMGQPRILMSMSRDGLLPTSFARIHPKYRTPSFSTIITGFLVGIPLFFMNMDEITDLTSIGTLFAFVLVCAGSIVLQRSPDASKRKFKVPYINGKYIIPAMAIFGISLFFYMLNHDYHGSLTGILGLKVEKGESAWMIYREKIPLLIFLIVSFYVVILSYIKSFSLIPSLGLLSCLYLMSELGYLNWLRFVLWFIIGIVIYARFSYKNSRLNKSSK